MSLDEHPLAKVLKNRVLELRVNRLLVLEWLFPEDEKTGSVLAHRVSDIGIPVEYVECATKLDVVLALRRVAAQSSGASAPIVHIEAHGEDGDDTDMPRGFVGPNGTGGESLLSWAELGEELRPINLATRFNLIVVGAACYGEGLLLAIEPGEPVPFVLALGYRGKVLASSLRDALIQFYRLYLGEKWPFGEALDAANREHRADDSELRDTSAAQLVLEGFCVSRFKSRLMESLPPQQLDALGRIAIADGWPLHFAFDQIPENEERFAIDVEELIRVSRLNPEWVD